jgi:hypothetical protein
MNIFLQQKKRKVFIPCKFKTDILGYWADNEGKLYTDNIIIQQVNALEYNRIKDKLFSEGEKAIFYTENDKAYIEDKEKILKLNEKREFCSSIINENTLKRLCADYGGCTVYAVKDIYGQLSHYKIEYWSK